jgi:hypothetical protein
MGLSNQACIGGIENRSPVNIASIVQEAQVSNRSECEIIDYNYPYGGVAMTSSMMVIVWGSVDPTRRHTTGLDGMVSTVILIHQFIL